MKQSLNLSLVYCLLAISSAAVAASQIPINSTSHIKSTPSRLHVGLYGGYGNVSGAYKNDGQVTQARLVLGINAGQYKSALFGTEIGVESGNNMRLEADAALISSAGGLPIQSTLKPMVDFLITVKCPLLTNYPIIGILKGGVAYRQLQLEDRSSSRDGLRKINPELQVGLGMSVTERAMVAAFYQGIYSGSTAGASLNSAGDVTISHIPTQQAVFVGVDYSL